MSMAATDAFISLTKEQHHLFLGLKRNGELNKVKKHTGIVPIALVHSFDMGWSQSTYGMGGKVAALQASHVRVHLWPHDRIKSDRPKLHGSLFARL
jgi:hypothetical protein